MLRKIIILEMITTRYYITRRVINIYDNKMTVILIYIVGVRYILHTDEP